MPTKNNKKELSSHTEEYMYSEEDDINNEIANQEYYLDTINIIRRNILGYVEDNSLCLCEYLLLKDLKTLLRKSNNF